MRTLLAVVIAAAALWSGYWVLGARTAHDAVADALAEARAAGWRAEADISVRGFPNRFDVTLAEPRLADPEGRHAWRAPFFQVLSLSYRPNHLILVWPDAQRLETPAGPVGVESDDLRASLVVGAFAEHPLRRFRMVGSGLAVRAEGERLRLARLLLALREREAGASSYEIGAELDGVRPPSAWLGDAPRPEGTATLRLDAVTELARPLDRTAVAGAPPRPETIEIRDASLRWGEIALTLTGTLAVTEAGYPEGELALASEDWGALLDLLRGAGALPEPVSGLLDGAAAEIASAGLDLPLVFADGRVSLGPLPIGPAPRLAAQRQ